MRLSEIVEKALRAARVPNSVAAKALARLEEVTEEYGVSTVRELYRLPDWMLWLVLVKGIVAPLTRLLRREGYCHANYFLLAAFMVVDERIGSMLKTWINGKCRGGLDPCCSSPRCCGVEEG